MGLVSPPYVPRFGSGAPNFSAGSGTIYYDVTNGYAPYIRMNGAWHASVVIGTGAPAFVAPAGTIYSREDAAGVYVSTPGTAAAAIVQSGFNSGTAAIGNVTLGAAPTAGNLLVSFFGGNGGAITALNAAWTRVDSNPTGNAFTRLLSYRYAQAGDAAALPSLVTTGPNQGWSQSVVEVSGVTGNFATDVLNFTSSYGHNANYNTPSQPTTKANQLGLMGITNQNGAAVLALPAGWTSIETNRNGNFGAQLVCDIAPASGTDLTAAINVGTGIVNCASQTLIINPGLSAGWTQIGP